MLPPIPDEFEITYDRRVRYVARPGTFPRVFDVHVHDEVPGGWRTLRPSPEDWQLENEWAASLAERRLEARKAEGGLVGREAVFTPEIVPRGEPDMVISGIQFYHLENHQQYDDDTYHPRVRTLVCSALAEGHVYLESVSEGWRRNPFCVPDAYVRFVDVEPDEVERLRAAWLAERAAEPPQPFIGTTRVREDCAVHVSPYDRRRVVLRAGEVVEVSARYKAALLYPGTTTSGVKHFDVRRASGEVLRCVDGTPLCVNMAWPSPDLPYNGPTIVDESRVRF